MKSIQALRERLAALSKDMNKMLADAGDKVWPKDVQAAYDGLADEFERGRAQLLAMEQQAEHDRETNFTDVENFRLSPSQQADQRKLNAHRTNVVKAMDLFLRKSDRQLTQQEAELIRNTMSTTTGSEGGHTVDPILVGEVIDKLKDYGAMRRTATTIRTATGVSMSWPTADATSEEGEIVAENQPATDADPSFGTTSMGVYKYSSKVITVPFELTQDSSIDIRALVMDRIRTRLGRIQDKHFTIGTGTAQPLGLIPAATVGKTGTTGQTTTVTYDDLVDVIDSLDQAYLTGDGLAWMFNQTTRRAVRKLKDSQGRPLWLPGYETQGLVGGFVDTLLGYRVEINNQMANMAANAKSIAFGRLSDYMIRDALEMQMFRFDDSAYVKKGQIGYMAWMRSGGNLLDTNGVRLYQNSAT